MYADLHTHEEGYICTTRVWRTLYTPVCMLLYSDQHAHTDAHIISQPLPVQSREKREREIFFVHIGCDTCNIISLHNTSQAYFINKTCPFLLQLILYSVIELMCHIIIKDTYIRVIHSWLILMINIYEKAATYLHCTRLMDLSILIISGNKLDFVICMEYTGNRNVNDINVYMKSHI